MSATSASNSHAYEPAGFVVFRTPILAWDDFLSWSANMLAPHIATEVPEDLRHAVLEDAAVLRERLGGVLSRPEIREAIFLSSPDLSQAMALWERDPTSERGVRAEASLLRYFARMTGRVTPFGLFAGCSLGKHDRVTRIQPGSRANYKRVTRLDFLYLVELCNDLMAKDAIRQRMRFTPNSSIYRAAGRWHYVESLTRGRDSEYVLVAIDATEHLDVVLSEAQSGRTIAELAATLIAPDVSADEATRFIEELVSAQLLVSSLIPQLSGGDALEELVAQLKAIPDASDTTTVLKRVLGMLREIDRGGIGHEPERYKAICNELGKLSTPVNASRLFQVDMAPAVEYATVSPIVVAEVQRAIQVLHRIGSRHDRLRAFREAFRSRYEREEVPLYEVLDPEVGIGIPGVVVGSASAPHDPSMAQAEAGRQAVLAELLIRTITSGDGELRLTEGDIARLAQITTPLPLPTSFAFIGTVTAANAAAVEQGEFRVISQGGAGPSGANLFGRFCHVDESLASAVQSYLDEEKSHWPNAILAEIIHSPEGRTGNVIARPILRDYEIPYLGRSGAPPEQQIPISDLMVRIENDRVILRSARLDREIIPRLTTAHNFPHARNLPFYQFLGFLQHQAITPGVDWNWGSLDAMPSLPRVVTGRTVLARAQWTLAGDAIDGLVSPDAASRFNAVQALRHARGLPRYVDCRTGDTAIPIDLDATLSVDLLVAEARKNRTLKLSELFVSDDEILACGPNGRFIHEMIMPFTNTATLPAEQRPPRPRTISRLQRRFTPASEWLYVKLYTGAEIGDLVLDELVRPVVTQAQASGASDGWFFLRYVDPEFHIRLRIHGDPAKLQSEVLPHIELVASTLMQRGVVSRIQYDTYVREIERYGGSDGMLIAERIFHADSEAALSLLEIAVARDPHVRSLLCMRGIDDFLSSAGLDGRLAIELLKTVETSDGRLRRAWGSEYRRLRGDISAMLGNDDLSEVQSHARDVLTIRRKRVAEPLNQLRRLCEEGCIEESFAGILMSHIHMHVNRVMRTVDALAERRSYDLLRRYREMLLSRGRERNQ